MNKPTLDKVRNYFYGRCNDGEEVRIQQWFADNGNSSEADRLLGTLLDEVRSENPALAQAAFEEFCRRIGHSVPARTAPRRLTTVVRWTQRIAAVLIVPLLIAVSLLYTKTAHTPEWEEVLVPAGQRSELRLADGTLLWLNSGTRVTYPTHFNGRQRKIFVDGEVYAEVMHDKRHPFVISAGDVEVEVLGTKFNMRAYNSDQLVEVALVEGSVRFDVNSDKCNDEVVMVRNDVAQYDRLTGALEMTSFQSETINRAPRAAASTSSTSRSTASPHSWPAASTRKSSSPIPNWPACASTPSSPTTSRCSRSSARSTPTNRCPSANATT